MGMVLENILRRMLKRAPFKTTSWGTLWTPHPTLTGVLEIYLKADRKVGKGGDTIGTRIEQLTNSYDRDKPRILRTRSESKMMRPHGRKRMTARGSPTHT